MPQEPWSASRGHWGFGMRRSPKGEQIQFERSTLRAVGANWTCRLFGGAELAERSAAHQSGLFWLAIRGYYAGEMFWELDGGRTPQMPSE